MGSVAWTQLVPSSVFTGNQFDRLPSSPALESAARMPAFTGVVDVSGVEIRSAMPRRSHDVHRKTKRREAVKLNSNPATEPTATAPTGKAANTSLLATNAAYTP